MHNDNIGPGQMHTLEPIAMELDEPDGTDDSGEDTQTTRTDDARRRSMDTSSLAQSTFTATDDDDEQFEPSHIDATAYGSRHKAMEVAIKEKTKRFLSLVKMDGVLKPNRSKWKDKFTGGPNQPVSNPPKKSMEFDGTSRRTSISSLASMAAGDSASIRSRSSAIPMSTEGKQLSGSSSRYGMSPQPSTHQHLDHPVEVFGTSATSSRLTSSPPTRGMHRRLSVLKRSMSGRSVVDNRDEAGQDGSDLVISGDNREGVYDSSKKQRVPSWVSNIHLQGRGWTDMNR